MNSSRSTTHMKSVASETLKNTLSVPTANATA